MNQPMNYPPPQYGAPPPQNNGYPPPNNAYPPPNNGYPPQNQGYIPPMNNVYFQPPGFPLAPPPVSGINKLASLPAIYIKQKFQKWEALTGCETPNVYYVYPADINGLLVPGSSPLFVAKEKSECLQRICCPGDLRAFDMKIYEFGNGVDQNGKPNKIEVMKFSREYKLTCMWFGRPEMDVYNLQKGGGAVPIGKIFSPYMLLDVGVDIYTNDYPKYQINGTCCQLGIICRGFPCQSCQEVRFDVLDYNTKQPIVPLLKKSSGCLKACFGDVDDFSVIFPVHSSVEDQSLLMASAIFIDYRYFEQNPRVDNKNGSAKRLFS